MSYYFIECENDKTYKCYYDKKQTKLFLKENKEIQLSQASGFKSNLVSFWYIMKSLASAFVISHVVLISKSA